ncbi:MAG: signal peptide peptidase SppA [Parvularculaceae bacterium]|nr:signal peptide peptidase SppA [Parvularculaceae bacterium]
MASEEHNFTVWGFIKGFGKLLIGFLLLLQGIIGLVMLLLVIGVAVTVSSGIDGGKAKVSAQIEEGSALLLNPNGVLVEQAPETDPFQQAIEEAYGFDEPDQIEVHDVIHAIRKAKDDKRIAGMVLDLGNLFVPSISASKLYDVAAELDAFRAAGKKIYAIGDYYGQEQYLLAAHADEVFMHDYGNVILYGYGSYGTYIKSLLEKLKVTTHVFRVGTFKSAVEPFIRDDMSPEAKEANLAFLNVLWDEFAADVEKARGLDAGAIKRYADGLNGLLQQAGGDFAKAALDYGLVDGLKSRDEQLAFLQETFGEAEDGASFKSVDYWRYVSTLEKNKDDGDTPNVAIVTAAGTIVDGEAGAGEAAGGDTIASYLKQALDDENVKAVVLRVDSPGGSAFASEIIRDGVVALKAAGKPVVVSMGSLAASGGYWISAPADEIWAAKTTITGSIGIFGLFTTFENSAAEIGVFTDGVGTSTLAPILATGLGPLPPEAADIFQRSTEDGYEKFLKNVGEGRDLDRDYVDSIGQGRVWIGSTAKDLKLVDKIGGLDEAVASAAKLAKLEKYDTVEIIETMTPFERLFGGASVRLMKLAGLDKSETFGRSKLVARAIKQVEEQAKFFDGFNDPNGLYARCLACESK